MSEGLRRNDCYILKVLRDLAPNIVFPQEIWLPYSDEPCLTLFHPPFKFQQFSLEVLFRGGSNYTLDLSFAIT